MQEVPWGQIMWDLRLDSFLIEVGRLWRVFSREVKTSIISITMASVHLIDLEERLKTQRRNLD